MPVYASSPEFDRLKGDLEAASADETEATRALSALLEAGADQEILKAATKRMSDAHNRKMDVIDQMQAHRLDKG